MSNRLPTVTIIVPARPGESRIAAREAVQHFDYPLSQLEMIVARGQQPSVQRNTAIKAAQGELIYFLDDDSCPAPDSLRRAAVHFASADVKMVGGPAVCPPNAPWIEQLFAVVLGSRFAVGPSRARYIPVGAVRETSEKELILCNLISRRDTLLELGGFDESLYPNEENALMDDIQKRGGKLVYDPAMIAERRPRPNLQAFINMLLTYGRGRAEQFRLHPTPGSALNFIPPLFCLYLIGWHVILAITFFHHSAPILLISTLPLLLYGLLLMVDMLGSIVRHGFVRGFLAVPLVVLTHICYGIGFWKGLFTKLQHKAARQKVEVVLEQVRW